MQRPPLGLVTFLIAATLSVSGCVEDESAAEPTVVKSTDGRFQVTIPSGWSARSDLNNEADIQVGNLGKEGYAVVFSESKEDFTDPTIDWYSEATRTPLLEGLLDGQITAGPKEIQINGHPALQYEIRGGANFIKMVYLHTAVDTGQHLHQILAWSLSSLYDDNRPEMESVINSFQATPE